MAKVLLRMSKLNFLKLGSTVFLKCLIKCLSVNVLTKSSRASWVPHEPAYWKLFLLKNRLIGFNQFPKSDFAIQAMIISSGNKLYWVPNDFRFAVQIAVIVALFFCTLI